MSAAREAAPQAAPEELEAKLIAPDELRLPDLSGLIKGATAVRLPSRHLEAIYFDTADLRLARNGLTLRYRSGEDGQPWTVKLPEGSCHAALRRREVSFSGTSAPVPPAASDLVRAWPGQPVGRRSGRQVDPPTLAAAETRRQGAQKGLARHPVARRPHPGQAMPLRSRGRHTGLRPSGRPVRDGHRRGPSHPRRSSRTPSSPGHGSAAPALLFLRRASPPGN